MNTEKACFIYSLQEEASSVSDALYKKWENIILLQTFRTVSCYLSKNKVD